jgi:hypothetical protein
VLGDHSCSRGRLHLREPMAAPTGTMHETPGGVLGRQLPRQPCSKLLGRHAFEEASGVLAVIARERHDGPHL